MSAHIDGKGSSRGTGPDWLPPAPLGLIGAGTSAASVAAPLLAGFAITLVGLVLQVQSALKWPDTALALLVGASLALLGAVQFGVWTSQYAVTPDQIAQWRPNYGPRALANVQRGHLYQYNAWYQRFRLAYHVGILLLLAGLAVALVPKKSTDEWRYVAIVLAALGVVAEMVWIWAGRYQNRGPETDWKRRLARRILPTTEAFMPPRSPSKAPEHWPEDATSSDAEWLYVAARLESVATRLDDMQARVRELESASGD